VPSGIQGLIPTVINKALHHEEINIWGDGGVVRDYIYVTDIAAGFVSASKYFGDDRIFNISTGVGYSTNEILEKLKKLLHYPLKIKHDSARLYDVPVNILDNSKARQLLKWEPKVGLEEGLEKTCRYLAKLAD
jgi:UDP-glucose 4-epimerase